MFVKEEEITPKDLFGDMNKKSDKKLDFFFFI